MGRFLAKLTPPCRTLAACVLGSAVADTPASEVALNSEAGAQATGGGYGEGMQGSREGECERRGNVGGLGMETSGIEAGIDSDNGRHAPTQPSVTP